MTTENFHSRSAMIDEKSEEFLKLLVSLGGYCTVAHAEELKLADTPRQARGHLRRLETVGFLRRVAAYPVVYQVTKSTTRHLERDSGTRRRHPLATVQARLLAVDFYLAACKWPAEFILDHEEKIATFTDNNCPASALPQRGGRPYLREEFLLWLPDGRLGVAIVDQPHVSTLSQMLGLVRRFAPVIRYMGEGTMKLLIATGNQHRYYLCRRLLEHPRLLAAWPSEFEFAVRPHLIVRPTLPVAALLCPTCHRQEHLPKAPHDHALNQPSARKRTNHLSSHHPMKHPPNQPSPSTAISSTDDEFRAAARLRRKNTKTTTRTRRTAAGRQAAAARSRTTNKRSHRANSLPLAVSPFPFPLSSIPLFHDADPLDFNVRGVRIDIARE